MLLILAEEEAQGLFQGGVKMVPLYMILVITFLSN